MNFIKLDSENRIIEALSSNYMIDEEGIEVLSLPNGNIFDYKYIDGKYVYEPLPEPELPPLDPAEERIRALEKEIASLKKAQFENI